MLSPVHARVAAEQQRKRDMVELTARVAKREDPTLDDTAAYEAAELWYPLAGHPMVVELSDQDETGPGAALAYMEDMEETDVAAVIRWMTAGAYKGRFESDAAFCEDQFASALDDHFAVWARRADVGFPDVALSDLIESSWEEIAYHAVGGPVMNTDDQVFYSIECGEGVYVFDFKIDIGQYRSE